MIRLNADLYRIAAACISKEETRYYLQGVNVEPHPVKGVILTSTDGHRMVCVHDENGFADETAIIRLSPAALKECKGVSKDFRSIANAVRFVVVDGLDATVFDGQLNDSVSGAEMFGTVAISPRCRINGTFPDYRRVIPTIEYKKESRPGAFNGQYLADFGGIAADLAKLRTKGSAPIVRVLSADPGSPALILFPNADHVFGVLMPIRGTDSQTVPAWFTAQPETTIAPEAPPTEHVLEAAE